MFGISGWLTELLACKKKRIKKGRTGLKEKTS